MIFLLCDPDGQFLAKNHFSEKKYAYMLITHQIKQEEVKSRNHTQIKLLKNALTMIDDEDDGYES